MPTFTKSTWLPYPRREVFEWHARPGAFERLAPPWENIRVIDKRGSIKDGDRLVMELKKGPVPVKWEALHSGYIDGERFCDEQVSGPFARWFHTHHFEDLDGGCTLTDEIVYEPPLGALGLTFGGGSIRSMLERMFAFRHQRTVDDLGRHRQYFDKPRLKVAISGASGLVGTALAGFLRTGGHEVYELVRRKPLGPNQIYWNVKEGAIDAEALAEVDAVVHLAGENIAGGPWTQERRRRIKDSRVQGTQLIADTLAKLETKPQSFICASAIGYYGGRGEEVLTEESAPGEGYLAEVCTAWEDACQPARDAGIRTANMRIGIIIAGQGGALEQMKLPFSLGLGGPLGTGSQFMSWVSLDDVIGIIYDTLMNPELDGPINTVGPDPVTNREFTTTLGTVLSRPTVIPAPAFGIKAVFGEMGDQLLLQGSRVVPKRMQDRNFPFLHPTLEQALRHELGRNEGAEIRVPAAT